MCLPGTIETVRARVEEEDLPKLDRRTALLGAAGVAVAAALPGRALGAPQSKDRTQDLTHEFREGFPGFLGAPAVLDRQTAVTIPANGFYGQIWSFWEHNCTHLDVPAHFVTGGRFSPQISLDELVRPLVVVDISDRAAADPDAEVVPGRPRPVRAASRADSARRRCRDELRLGCPRRQRRRVPERRRGRAAALPRLRKGGGRVAAGGAGHRRHRRRHAQPRPRSVADVRRACGRC